ncbi:glycosyltransferase [Pseudomonas sp. Marseille-QA0892]
MKILFVHQNFPGQFKHLFAYCMYRGDEVIALGEQKPNAFAADNVVRYQPAQGTTQDMHPWAKEFESKVIRAEAASKAALSLKAKGFEPDVILAHPGWGEALLLKTVFPRAKLICLMEYFYRAEGFDMGFDPEFKEPGFEEHARLLSKNANLLLAMEAMDYGVSPTAFQASTLPAWAAQNVRLIHEGIDTALCIPNPNAVIKLPDRGLEICAGDEVLTFVVRNLEPVRGYHVFMRALPAIMAQRPNVKVFIVGGDGVSYGSAPENGSYRSRYLAEVAAGLDPSRVFFLGKVPHTVFISLMQITRCHVYLTYPFVLGWSVLEAMSCGALVVGSRTAPVEEVIEDGKNGLLVDFFDIVGLSERVCNALEAPEAYEAMRARARETVITRFDLQRVSLPAYARLLDESTEASPGA